METLIALWIKWRGVVKIKHKDFIDAFPIMPCQYSSWIMGLRIYGEGKTQILLNSPATIVPWQGSKIVSVYTDITVTDSTKIKHIMVSFTDHYNAISVERLPSESKMEMFHGTLIILFYVSPSTLQLQRLFFFYWKIKKEHPLFSKWLVRIHQILFYREC